jgi:para-nitrobenzyl esterase
VFFAGVVSIIGTGGSSSNNAKSGVFLDSPVQGLSYTTPTLTGTTGPDGTFRYKSGETVSFYVGELFLGEAPGQAEITPVDIVNGAADTTDPAVINIARLLQTLDADGDNNNGIQISQQTAAIVSEAGSVNFSQSTSDFGSDSVVTGLIAELNAEQVFTDGNPLARTLKPADQAQ